MSRKKLQKTSGPSRRKEIKHMLHTYTHSHAYAYTYMVVNALALITVNERWGCSGSVRESYYESREDVEVKKLFW